MKKMLEFIELEEVYDLVAGAIDEVGVHGESLFLSKLAMTLAHRVGDMESVRDAIRIARGSRVDHLPLEKSHPHPGVADAARGNLK
jgi:hypothetical protein